MLNAIDYRGLSAELVPPSVLGPWILILATRAIGIIESMAQPPNVGILRGWIDGSGHRTASL